MRKLRPGILYTRGEMKKLMTPEEARGWQAAGYVLQSDINTGKLLLVHHTKAAGTGQTGTGLFTPSPSIQKRTATQRVDSLMLKLVEDMKKHKGLATLQSGQAARVSLGNGQSRPATTEEIDAARRARAVEEVANEERMREILGAAFVAGRTEVTADMVRQVAANLLARAEKQHEAKLAKQITRHED